MAQPSAGLVVTNHVHYQDVALKKKKNIPHRRKKKTHAGANEQSGKVHQISNLSLSGDIFGNFLEGGTEGGRWTGDGAWNISVLLERLMRKVAVINCTTKVNLLISLPENGRLSDIYTTSFKFMV